MDQLTHANKDNEFDPPGLDYTFCNDPNCNNECGRKISKRLKELAKTHPKGTKMSYFITCPAKEK